MATSVNGLSGTFPAVNPAFKGGYVFSENSVAGVALANNFISLANPVGSGRVILLAGVFLSQLTTGAVSAVDPMRGYLATNVAGGTLQPASDIGKVRSTMPNAVGEIRLGPTATLGAAWFNSPTLQATGASTSSFIHQVPATIPAGSITLLPGEGTVLRTETGSTNTLWNISIAWSEI